ncbi:MAG: hypothetical protein ACPHT7_05325 [Litorivicinaceae bacterium]
MVESVADRDKYFFATIYEQEDMKPLSPQKEKFLLYFFRGMSLGTACNAVGLTPTHAQKFVQTEQAIALLNALRAREAIDLTITREKLTSMLLDAHSHSATATEEVAVIRELGKMHDLYADNKKQVEINVNKTITNVTQIERASDEELIKLAGSTIDLDPSAYALEYDQANESAQ